MSTILQNSELRKGLVFYASLSDWSMTPGATTTSGSLVIGKTYTIKLFVAGDSFTNVGAASNATGVTFVATGTTPTTWTNSSQLTLQKYGYMDMVSKAVGVATDCVPVLDKNGSGRRWLEYNGTSSYTVLPTLPAFGTGDFTIIIPIYISNYADWRCLIGGQNNCFGLTVNAQGKIDSWKVGVVRNGNGSSVIPIGNSTIVYKRASGVGTIYINGVADVSTITDTQDYTAACTSIAKYKTGSENYFNGSISMCRIFNYSLSQSQVANYSRPEYAIEWVDRIIGTPGLELITPQVNKDFSGANNWINTNIATFDTSGDLSISGSVSQYCSLHPNYVSMVANKKYLLQVGVTNISGTIRIFSYGAKWYNGDVTPFDITSNGVNKLIATSTDAGGFRVSLFTNGSSADLDNFSVVQLGCILDLNAEGMSSATWIDKTNSLTATNSGTVFNLPSASNLKASYFNGSTSKVDYTGVNGLTGDITISFWYLKLSNGVDYSCLFSNGQIILSNDNSNGALLFVRAVTGTLTSSANMLTIGTWVHVCITSTSTGITNFYKNGALWSSPNLQTSTPVSSTSLTFGNRTSGSYYSNGLIARPTIWSRILTADEIALLNAIL